MSNNSNDPASSNRKLSPLPQFASTGTLRPETLNRSDIPKQYKWNLTDIYASWENWEKELEQFERLSDELIAMKGSLKAGMKIVEKAYQLQDTLGRIMVKVGGFAHLHFDLDQRNTDVNALQQRAQLTATKISTALSWFTPELLEIPWKVLSEWIDQSDLLRQYRFPISELYRTKEHILDEDGERLLAYTRRLNQVPAITYEMISTADVRWPSIVLSTGETKVLSPSSYNEILETCRSQEDRRAAFEAHFKVFKSLENTYAALYNGVCQKDYFIARSRKYKNSLEVALDDDAIPAELYTNLIATTRKGVEPLQRYYRLRKKFMNLERFDLYDTFVPILKSDKRYPYDSVIKDVVSSVAPLGEDYQKRVAHAFQSGWVDVYESDGKRSGAYSSGIYGVHPYILLNYNDTIDYMFTVAHEFGHSLHTLYAQEKQPYATAGYTIFVAEVASTLNEALLHHHLLQTTEDPIERIILLEHAIKNISSTFYTQVRFADFELEAHRIVEENRPVTTKVLSDLTRRQLKDYLGDSVDLHELYDLTWSRIPHFYRTPFYVFQYATSFAASAMLVKNILPGSNGPGKAERQLSVNKYLNLLRAGGSAQPIELLLDAGVDMLKPEPIQAVIDTLDSYVNQLEEALTALPG